MLCVILWQGFTILWFRIGYYAILWTSFAILWTSFAILWTDLPSCGLLGKDTVPCCRLSWKYCDTIPEVLKVAKLIWSHCSCIVWEEGKYIRHPLVSLTYPTKHPFTPHIAALSSKSNSDFLAVTSEPKGDRSAWCLRIDLKGVVSFGIPEWGIQTLMWTEDWGTQ